MSLIIPWYNIPLTPDNQNHNLEVTSDQKRTLNFNFLMKWTQQ